MTQFTPSGKLSRPRFNLGLPGGPRIGVENPSLPTPTVPGDETGRQLQGVINDFAQTVGIAGGIARQEQHAQQVASDRAESKRLADEEKALRIAANSAKGGAAQTARELIPQKLDEIKNGNFVFLPEDKGSPERAVNRMVNEQVEVIMAGLPEEHQGLLRESVTAEFDRVFSPRMLSALYEKEQSVQKAAMDGALDKLSNRILLTQSPAELSQVMSDAAYGIPGVTDEQLDGVLGRTMLNFAKDNKPELVAASKKLLGNRGVDYQMRADDFLETAKARADAENRRAFADEGAMWQMRVSEGKASLEEAKAGISAAAKARGLGDNALQSQVGPILTALEAQHKADVEKQKLETAWNGVLANNASTVAAYLADAGAPSGFGQRMTFAPLPGFPEGMGSVANQKRIFIGEARRQSGIDLNNLDSTDPTNAAKWQRYVRGLANAGVEDDDLKNRLLALDLNSADATDQKASQRNLLSAQTYAMLHQINPVYASNLVGSDPKAKVFYDNVMIQMRTPGAVDTAQMIRSATAKASINPTERAQPTDREWKELQAKAPGLSPSLMQYAVKTYREQQGQGGAAEYAIEQASGRGVQLWQSYAGWANPAVPFTRSNASPYRPFVELGTLADVDPSIKPKIGAAMEALLTERAKEINKADPTLKMDPTEFRLNYTGNGVWEIEGIPAGRFNEQQDDKWFVTDGQIRERIKADSETKKPTAQLEAELAEAREYVAQVEEWRRTGKIPTVKGRMSVGGMDDGIARLRKLETELSVRKLTAKKTNP